MGDPRDGGPGLHSGDDVGDLLKERGDELTRALAPVFQAAYIAAREHRWHNDDPELSDDLLVPRLVALGYSEWSEALEAFRKDEGHAAVFAEIADVIIRAADSGIAFSWRLTADAGREGAAAVIVKLLRPLQPVRPERRSHRSNVKCPRSASARRPDCSSRAIPKFER